MKTLGIHEKPNRAKEGFRRREKEDGEEIGCKRQEREETREQRQRNRKRGEREQRLSRKKVLINLHCPHQPPSLVKSSSQVLLHMKLNSSLFS